MIVAPHQEQNDGGYEYHQFQEGKPRWQYRYLIRSLSSWGTSQPDFQVMGSKHQARQLHILSIVHAAPFLLAIQFVLVETTEWAGVVLQQYTESQLGRYKVPREADMSLIIGSFFLDKVHQVAAPAYVIEIQAIRVMALPILQCLAIHLHQTIGSTNPYISQCIHLHSIRVDELAHQAFAIAKMLEVLHLIVGTIKSTIGGKPERAFHIIQEAI